MLDALVIAPHPDDAELGMGGTIVRLIGQGWTVGILDLTSGEPTPLGSLEIRAAETAAATAALGDPWRRNLGPAQPEPGADPAPPPGPGRGLPRGPARGSCSPPSGKTPTPTTPRRPSSSRTPGSGASSPRATSPASRSTRPGSSTTSASTSGSSSGRASCSTSPTSSRPRSRALRCYRSQLVDNQPAGRPGVIDSVCDRTRFWGHTVGVRHAEPFASREPIGLTGLDGLLL